MTPARALPRARAALLAATVLAAVVAVLLPSAPARAAGDLVAPAAPDFATETWADPWDFGGGEDVLLDQGPTQGLQGAQVADGLLSWSMSSGGYLSPLWGGYPGALFLGREGGAPANQVDAARYPTLSLQLWASRDTSAGLMWFTCAGLDPSCEGGRPLQLRAGWHTYDVPMVNSGYGLPQAWAGRVTGLRLALSPSAPTSFALDWARLHGRAPALTVPGTALAWAVAGAPAGDVPGRGTLPCSGGSCDLSGLPPGTYVLTAPDGTARTATLRRPATPVVLDPDAVGGADAATAAGDPWDLSSPSDVAQLGNATATSYGPGGLAAVNSGPVRNDPFVWLRLPGGAVDPVRFHRMTVRSGHTGPFDLSGDPGGGTHGRVVWQRADQPPGTVVQTKEWVTYSGTRTLTADLAAPDVHEEDVGNRLPWTGATVTGLRWDPNEDPGPKAWTLQRVALRADDEAGTTSTVRWYDAGYAPGSTVSLYRDADGAGFDGTPIATGLAQAPGTNAYTWDVRDVPAGRWWVYAVVDGPAGTGRSYSGGPVVVDHARTVPSPSPFTPVPADLDRACPQDRVPEDGLSDVSGVHEPSVDCVVWWGVGRGTAPGAFSPAAAVTRGQMASFLARLLAASGVALPQDPPDAFDDDDGRVEELAVDQLAALGVVAGTGPRRYAPAAAVSRAQMATFLVRTAQLRTGRTLPVVADAFEDDGTSAHRTAIDQAAAAGIATGTSEGRYGPDGTVTRGQMATFLARLLDVLVAGGDGAPPA